MNKPVSLLCADNIRILSAAMVEKARSGHPGGAMGGADFIHILYSEFLDFDPSDPKWFLRDRFFLDPGHMSPMLYSILTLSGLMDIESLKNFRQWGSITPGHPELDLEHGIENTSGPLGQGHAMAVGAAIAERFLAARFGDIVAHKTYAYISDGGIQEEISQGAGRIAGHLGLSGLIMFYDSNDIQLSTETNAVTSEDTALKYQSWGWNVITIDGHNHDQIRKALSDAKNQKEKPTLIIGKTIMGKGAVTDDGKSFERQCETHGQPLSSAGASFEKTIKNLGGNPNDPFIIFDEVKKYYQQKRSEKIAVAENRKAITREWAAQNPEKALMLEEFFSGKPPKIDYKAIVQKNNIATRAASAVVLGELAKKAGNMIVCSADLANSDKTDGFLKNTRPFTRNDFSGAFLHAGVSELTMAALCNGIALHGGVFAACGTFFVFSDYMKPAVRLSALMQLPVKYIWTHDAFRVGEDGPTHQPVEHEAQIRLMEQLKNHHGNMSLLALRPADAAETNIAWEMALENTKSPTALILSRQNINDLPVTGNSSRITEAMQARKGAYIVVKHDHPDVILIASGSEVSTLVAASGLLKNKGIQCQVVSVISEGLFRQQPPQYQENIIPTSLPKFGLTAGLPITLRNLCGDNGVIHGLESFGFSAPAGTLDDKLGFMPQNVADKIEEMLKKK